MDKYIDGFKQLELQASNEVSYTDAKQYAERFQKASVVPETPVRYSSSSSDLIKNHAHSTISWK